MISWAASIRLAGGLALDVAGDQHGLTLRIVFHRGDELRLRLLGGQPGNALEGLLLLSLNFE